MEIKVVCDCRLTIKMKKCRKPLIFLKFPAEFVGPTLKMEPV